MAGLPRTDLVSRGDIRAVLGVGNSTVDKWVRNGVLTKVILPGLKYAKYARAEVIRNLGLDENGRVGP